MPLLQGQCTDDTKAAFHALAQRHGLTESALLRQIVAAVLSDEKVKSSGPELFAGSRGGRTGQLRLRLREQEVARIRELAEPAGQSAQAWVVAMLRQRLESAVPFAKAELQELREAIRAIGPIGRNLNTITYQLLRTDQYALRAQEIAALTQAVEAMRQAITATVTRARHRAGANDG